MSWSGDSYVLIWRYGYWFTKLKCPFIASIHTLYLSNMIYCTRIFHIALQLRHNERESFANDWCLDCLPKRLFRRRSKKTSKLRVAGLCEGNPQVTGGFLSQRASNAEDVFDDVIMSIGHAFIHCYMFICHLGTVRYCLKITDDYCPMGWFNVFGYGCYSLAPKSLNLIDVNLFCENHGAYLATIETAQENYYLKHFLKMNAGGHLP